MNKTYIAGIIAVVVVGAIAVLVINHLDLRGNTSVETEAPVVNIARPAVKPVANTFSIMTPEEKAAADEAARVAAEEAAKASSTSTSSATTTEEEADDTDTAAPVEDSI